MAATATDFTSGLEASHIFGADLSALQLHPIVRSAIVSNEHYFIAGGAALGLVLGERFPGSDIDVFTISQNECNSSMQRNTVRDIITACLANGLQLSVKCTSCAVTIYVRGENPSKVLELDGREDVAGIINSIAKSISVGPRYRPVQFVKRCSPDLQALFDSFDLQPCEVALDPRTDAIYMTQRASDSIRDRTIDLSQTKPMHQFESRLGKYLNRGFRAVGTRPSDLTTAPYTSEVTYENYVTHENLEAVLANVDRTFSEA